MKETGSYSEKVLEEILVVMKRDRCSLFDACLNYCEEKDLDVEDLAEWLDPYAHEMLRKSALDNNKVRKCVAEKPESLDFEDAVDEL